MPYFRENSRLTLNTNAKTFFILALAFVLSAAPLFAETAIRAEVSKTSISTDDTLTYKLSVTTTENNLPEPKLPKFDGFEVISQAQSSNLSFARNEMKSTMVFEFVLVATEAGKFKIGPSTIKAQGETYSTDSFEIEVAQGKLKPKAPEEIPPPESDEPQYTL